MKKIIVLFSIFCFLSCANTEDIKNTKVSSLWSSNEISNIKFDKDFMPTQNQINAIYLILQNTAEINIHKMRGETENQVFINENKENGWYPEAVFDKKGDLVTNNYNKWSFNFFLYKEEPLQHFIFDMLPWLVWWNSKNDPTDFNERFYHYLNDLNRGIQNYIFKSDMINIENIDIEKLNYDELMTIRLFSYILFNDNYSIKLTKSNQKKLIDDADFYWSYFYQIHEILGLKQEE